MGESQERADDYLSEFFSLMTYVGRGARISPCLCDSNFPDTSSLSFHSRRVKLRLADLCGSLGGEGRLFDL